MSEVVTEPEPTPELTGDAIYDALADQRRRYALHHLKQVDEPVSVRSLAEQVAAWENEKTVAELTSQERKRVYIALYQYHLDTLDDQGLVDYDEEASTVTVSPAFDDVDVYLEVVPRANLSWNRFYVGLTAANALVLLLAGLGLAPFDQVPPLAWGVVVLASFGLSALVQTYDDRRMRFGDAGPPPEIVE